MTPRAAPRISVVTPTHNRRDSVVRLLDRLRDGTFPHDGFEVVVVADGCHDDTIAVLRAASYPFPLQVLEQSPGRGAATARNRGAAVATGEIVIFIDDDIEPLPTLLAAHAAAHAAANEPLVVIGAPIPVRTPDSDFQHLAVWGWWEQQFERMRLPGHRFTYDQVFSGILSMPAALFSAVGGFEVALNSCRDDSELGLRLIRAGARITYSREAGGYHHEMRDRTRLIQRKQAEGRADVLLARKYPDLWWTLRLSQGAGHSLPLRVLHRVARTMPRLGDLVAGALAISLGPLERFRLRNTWRQVHAGVMYYAYWRGAMRALATDGDGTAALAELARRGDDPVLGHPLTRIDIDLADGFEVAERRLDRERPDGARVRLGEQWIGNIPVQLGAEPLRGIHLRCQLASASLGWAVLHAAALEAFSSPRREGAVSPDATSTLPPEERRQALAERICRVAGAVLAQGRPATRLLVHHSAGHPIADHDACAAALFEGAFGDTGDVGEAVATRWVSIASGLEEFLVALERHAAQRGVARSIRIGLERRVASIASLPRPLTLGLSHTFQAEVTAPIGETALGDGVERVLVLVTLEGDILGALELPVIDGLLSGAVLRDAIADRFAWPILGRLFERTEYREIEFCHEAGGWTAWRSGGCVARELPGDAADRRAALHDRIGWPTFVGLLWRDDIGITASSQPDALHRAADPGSSAPPWVLVEAAEPLRDRQVGAASVVVELRVAGAPVDAIEVATDRGVLHAASLREALIEAAGYELVCVAVREALLGNALDDATPLPVLLRTAARRARGGDTATVVPPQQRIAFGPDWEVEARRALPDGRGGAVIARRNGLASHTAVARAARLPAALQGEFSADAAPMITVQGTGRPLLAYAPSLLWRRLAPAAMATAPGAAPEGASTGVVSSRLPILMYHRVAPAGVPARDRYRMTPARFEEQLRYLRDSGYRSASLEEWRWAAAHRRSLPGRAVLLTFDDGYRDFEEHAWPLLRRHGFGATVFLVTGSIGRWNTWDPEQGEEEPLLDWRSVRRLRDEGVEFGAHSVSHRPLTLLPPEEIVREAVHSRAAIETEIGGPVTAFAYPYGDEDAVIHHLIGAAGFGYGLTCRPATAALDMPMLVLPRLEVRGTDDLAAFAAKLAEP